jgi:hypothetical protein
MLYVEPAQGQWPAVLTGNSALLWPCSVWHGVSLLDGTIPLLLLPFLSPLIGCAGVDHGQGFTQLSCCHSNRPMLGESDSD